jgi:hypothetical protein
MDHTPNIFTSSVRSAGDLAGVFEYSDGVGWFYLYDLRKDKGSRVVASVHIVSVLPEFDENDIDIRWTKLEDKVGFFVRHEVWAVIDQNYASWGGNYRSGSVSSVPERLSNEFRLDIE